MNKPLSIEEVKQLEVGGWVWIISLDTGTGHYFFIEDKDEDCLSAILSGYVYTYSKYGTKWIAYRNREEAEGTDIHLPCKIGDTVYAVYRDNEDNEYKMEKTKCIGFEVLEDQIDITIEFIYYNFCRYKYGKFVNKEQAKAKLKSLQERK